MIRQIGGISLILLASGMAWAQPSEPALSFDAASLKRTQSPGTATQVMRQMKGGPGSTDPGQFTYVNVTLKLLIQMAYDLKEYQVQGPDWIDGDGFDIVAKMPPGTTQEQAERMMRSLLAERFHLALHREKKPMQVYALTVAKGGSRMKEVEVTPPAPDAPPPDPRRMGSGPGIRLRMSPNGIRMAGYMTMREMADQLTRRLEHPVLDETELKKTYDVDITWMPDESDSQFGRMRAMSGGPGGGPGGEAPRAMAEPAMTLAQALQDKLGLRLDARKSDADILIVDRADRVPVEN